MPALVAGFLLETKVADTIETSGESASVETAGQSTVQSGAPVQTTGNGTAESGESFFDYETIRGKPELEAAHKEMQGAFTRKTQEMAVGRDKITQYDQFMANPVDTMRRLAQQRGYQLVQGQPGTDGDKPKTFENWDDVMAEAKSQVMAELGPMFGEIQSMKKQGIELALDNAYPDWRTYEDGMMENLEKYPNLVNDHDMLYRMSVPANVMEARALKAANAKIQGTTESSKVSGQSTTTQQAAKQRGKMSFDEAVKFAKAELASKGLKPPRE